MCSSDLATTGTIQVIGGVAIGCLLPHRWYLAVGEAWGAVLIGLALSLVTLAQGFESTRILVIALCLLVIPGISLLAGRLGLYLMNKAAARQASD